MRVTFLMALFICSVMCLMRSLMRIDLAVSRVHLPSSLDSVSSRACVLIVFPYVLGLLFRIAFWRFPPNEGPYVSSHTMLGLYSAFGITWVTYFLTYLTLSTISIRRDCMLPKKVSGLHFFPLNFWYIFVFWQTLDPLCMG